MSRPPILFVIHLFPQQRWLAIFGPQEKRVAFGRNGITVELALLSSSGIVVVILYLENRTRDDVASVGERLIEPFDLTRFANKVELSVVQRFC